jgi:hypothetical protein
MLNHLPKMHRDRQAHLPDAGQFSQEMNHRVGFSIGDMGISNYFLE